MTDDTDGVRTQAMKAFKPIYYDEDSPVDPTTLSFQDSVRAFGAYKKAAKVATRHADELLSTANQELAGLENSAKVRPSAAWNAKRLVTGIYKASLSPEVWSLTNSIQRAAQEGASPQAVTEFMNDIVTFEPKLYDEFKQFMDFKRVRQVDQFTLESEISGKKDPSEVSAWLHTDRERRIAQVATESKATGILHDLSSPRFFGDTLREVARPTKATSTQVAPLYVKTLISCLGGEDTAQAEIECGSGDSRAVSTGSQPGPDGASTSENQLELVSSFNADAVRNFLARDLPVKKDGTFADSVNIYAMK
jgi:hypothetical protein